MQKRIPQLDGLRGIAILLVLEFHYQFIPLSDSFPFSIITQLLKLTWSGVDLFFVLSGFLLGGILLSNRDSDSYFKPFYIRRFCRILPLYMLVLALFLVFRQFSAPVLPEVTYTWLFREPIHTIAYSTFTQNIEMVQKGWGSGWLFVTWSLAVEEQFYLGLPFVIRFCPPRYLPKLLIGFIVAAPLFRLFCLVILHSFFGAFFLMPSRADALMLGVLCAYGLQKPQVREWITNHLKLLYGALAIFVIVDVWLGKSGPLSFLMQSFGYTWLALGYTCLLIVAVSSHGFISGLTKNRVLGSIGIIAYGIYLFHEPVEGILAGLILGVAPSQLIYTLPRLVVHVIAFALTIAGAVLSWNFFERRFVRIGHRYQYRSQAESAAVSLPASEST